MIKFNMVMAIAILLFICVVALGGSPRAMIPIVPYFLLSIFMIVRQYFGSFQQRISGHKVMTITTGLIFLFFLSLQGFIWGGDDLSHIKKVIFEGKRIASMQKILIEKEKITSPKEVVCTSSNIYLPTLKPYTFFPMGGGWGSYNPDGANRAPKLAKENLDSFIKDCRKNHISHLILAENAGKVMDDFGRLYLEKISFPNLLFIANISGLKLYRIQ